MNKGEIVRYLEERADDFYSLSDSIWERAEIRFKEKQSVEDYEAFLKKEGFKVTVGLVSRQPSRRSGAAESL